MQFNNNQKNNCSAMTNCIGAYYLFLFAVSKSLRLKSRNNCQHSRKPIYVTGTGQQALDNEHWTTSTGQRALDNEHRTLDTGHSVSSSSGQISAQRRCCLWFVGLLVCHCPQDAKLDVFRDMPCLTLANCKFSSIFFLSSDII